MRSVLAMQRLLVLLSLAAETLAQTPCTPGWVDRFRIDGPDEMVRDMEVVDSTLYLCGRFESIDGQPVYRLAKRTGGSWERVPGWTSGDIDALGTYQGQLLVAGEILLPGHEDEVPVALWNGTQWTPMGVGYRSWSIIDVASEGDQFVLIGGILATDHWDLAALWNGSDWEFLPHLAPGSNVNCVALYQGEVYVGGYLAFDESQERMPRIAKWSGGAWVDVPWADSTPSAFVVFNDVLLIGALAPTGTPVLSSFDGVSWKPIATSSGDYDANRVDGLWASGDRVVMVGTFEDLNGTGPTTVAAWNGAGFESLGPVIDPIAMNAVEWLGSPVVAGTFVTAGASRCNGLAMGTGNSWQPFGNRGNGIFSSGSFAGGDKMVAHQGELVVLGGFLSAGDVSCRGFVSWNGERWAALDLPPVSSARDFISFQGQLFAAGWFFDEAAQDFHPLARWDGESWIAVDSTFFGIADHLIEFRGGIAVQGHFHLKDHASLGSTAIWKDGQWTIINSGQSTFIHGMIEYQDNLVVLRSNGSFGQATEAVVQWDGNQWSNTGIGTMHNGSSDMIVFEDQLYLSSGHIWNGHTWRFVAPPPSGSSRTFAVHDRRLYQSSGTFSSRMYRFENGRWITFGGLINDRVTSAAVFDDGQGQSLFLGGDFTLVDGLPSSRIAQYTTCPCPADANDDNFVNGLDLSILLARFSGRVDNPYEAPDYNGDRDVGIDDLSYLLSRFGNSCP